MYNPRDSNSNYEEGIQDVSNEVVEKKAQMNHVVDAPELADGDNGKVINMNSMKDSKDDSCKEIQSDEKWVKEYGDNVWSSEEVAIMTS